jgi:thioredoxin-related protein
MKKFILFKTILVIVCLIGQTGMSFGSKSIWTTNWEAALTQAQNENKDILLYFAGSDWCTWCFEFEKEIFSNAVFEKKAPEQFILVMADFPQKKELPENLVRQNQSLLATYRIAGFPTILLTDSLGNPFAKTGYIAGGAENYIAHLTRLKENKREWDQIFPKAQAAQGLEKAKLLDQALDLMQANGYIKGNQQIIAQIVGLDEDNELGLKAKYEVPDKFAAIELEVNQTKNFDKALHDLDALLASHNPEPETTQNILLYKAILFLEGKNNPGAAVKEMQKAAQSAPETELAKRIPSMIDSIRKE